MTIELPGSAESQYLTFSMANEEYAVDLARVREVLEYGAVTALPKAPPWLRGVLNLRGSVVPVVDLARKLELPETMLTRTTCIVVIESQIAREHLAIGVVAESVNQVVDVTPEMFVTPPSYGTTIRSEFLVGMTPSGAKFTLLVDIDGVLTPNDLAAMQELTADRPTDGDVVPREA